MLEISNAAVQLYKHAFGRGPTKAHASFAGADTLVILLENTLTIAERNLVALGEHQRLRQQRLRLQQALEGPMRALAERAFGRHSLRSSPASTLTVTLRR
jgi:uncharacterized protein YbcI